MPINLWDSPDHVRDYLGRADSILHRSEGESTLLEFLPNAPRRILDLGTGDGRLLALVKTALTERETAGDRDAKVEAMAVDFSPAMLEAARKRFAGDSSVTIVAHNLDQPLPRWEGSTRSYPASQFIICFTNENARSMPRFTPC